MPRDPDRIECVFKVAADGIALDIHDNFHKTLEGAKKYAARLTHLPDIVYSVLEITTIETEHPL